MYHAKFIATFRRVLWEYDGFRFLYCETSNNLWKRIDIGIILAHSPYMHAVFYTKICNLNWQLSKSFWLNLLCCLTLNKCIFSSIKMQWCSQPSLTGGAKWKNCPNFCHFFPIFLFFPKFPFIWIFGKYSWQILCSEGHSAPPPMPL